MTLAELAEEYAATRAPGWLVLDEGEIAEAAISAARFYAGYGSIASIALSDVLPGAPAPGDTTLPAWPDPEPETREPRPIKDLAFITAATKISVGEWAIIKPLFVLYAEREHAQRLEASRASGLEHYGRNVSEIAADIMVMEAETLPAKAFVAIAIEVS